MSPDFPKSTIQPGGACYAEADRLVWFEAEANCSCTCDGVDLTYKWWLTTEIKMGDVIWHAFGGGLHCPFLEVECNKCHARATTAGEDKFTVYVIDRIEVTKIGAETPPENYRLCFNVFPEAGARVLPATLPSSAGQLIDWTLEVGNVELRRANTDGPSFALFEDEWPYDYNGWGATFLEASIGGTTLEGQDDEIVTADRISVFEFVDRFFDKWGQQHPLHDGSEHCFNWFYYWAFDNGGPCTHHYCGPSMHFVSVSWEIDQDILPHHAACVPDGDGYIIKLTGNVASLWSADTFSSPRFPWPHQPPPFGHPAHPLYGEPPVGEFIDSQGEPRHFDAGKISFSYPDLVSVDACEGVIRHELGHVWVGVQRDGPWKGADDKDEDRLADFFEDQYGTYFDDDRSYDDWEGDASGRYGMGNDEELFCDDQIAEPGPPNLLDWAYPGKQWPAGQ